MDINKLFKNGSGSTDVQNDIDATQKAIDYSENIVQSNIFKQGSFNNSGFYNVNVYSQLDIEFYKYINTLTTPQKANKDQLIRALKTATDLISNLLYYQKGVIEKSQDMLPKYLADIKSSYLSINGSNFYRINVFNSFIGQLDIIKAFNCNNLGGCIIGDVNSINSIDTIKTFLYYNISNLKNGVLRINTLINCPIYSKFSTTNILPVLQKGSIINSLKVDSYNASDTAFYKKINGLKYSDRGTSFDVTNAINECFYLAYEFNDILFRLKDFNSLSLLFQQQIFYILGDYNYSHSLLLTSSLGIMAVFDNNTGSIYNQQEAINIKNTKDCANFISNTLKRIYSVYLQRLFYLMLSLPDNSFEINLKYTAVKNISNSIPYQKSSNKYNRLAIAKAKFDAEQAIKKAKADKIKNELLGLKK